MTLPTLLCVYAALSLPAAVTTPTIIWRPVAQASSRSMTPDMAHIPKSYLVSGLLSLRGQTFFTGPNGAIVMGPMNIRDFSVRMPATHRR